MDLVNQLKKASSYVVWTFVRDRHGLVVVSGGVTCGGVGLSQGTYDNLFFIHIVRKTNRFGINHTCEM